MQIPATFQVYNASAGSGKTFTLVKEYLKIILISNDVFTFQKVLAITFTNKAAAEMKERVLFNLEEFALGKENDLLLLILKETSIEKRVVKEKSKKILSAILQNYTAFSITTIDSFTHKIIKNFAFDLGLSLNFEVEMDAVSLLNEAIDVLISKIGNHEKLTKILINYTLEKIDDDTSWDITKDLNDFAKILLFEENNEHFKKLSKKKIDDFLLLKSTLIATQKELKLALQKIGSDALHLINSNGLEPNDFIRKTVPNFFSDIKEKSVSIDFINRSTTIEKAIENHQFYTKNTSKEITTSIEAIVPEIVILFKKAKEIYKLFLLHKLTLKSIVPLAVLNNINTEINTLKEENNIRLNAEFNQLISDHIKDQPAPFIYEKIGQRFMYYFIDEMQDTSLLQWQNLIPLISNALAQENSSLLLVGDAKQAIYRWRGGKAEQFITLGLPKENPFNVKKEIQTLETNFRSYTEIINFNNSFFKHTAKFLQNETYKNLFIEGNNQLVNQKQGGFITISFLEKEEDKDTDNLKYPKKVLEKIIQLQKGFYLHEICVLVRKRKDGIAIANYLSENGVPIISSETLLLKNNAKIAFIVHLMQYLQNPKDEDSQFEVLYFLWQHLQIKEPKHQFLKINVKTTPQHIFTILETNGVFFSVTTYHQLPFYEKIEEIIRSFNLAESSDAYLQFFLDVVLEQQRKGIDVQGFLDVWELKKEQLSIVAPESANAVQIMTIHKSKGLEFPVVIFPCDVEIHKEINPKAWLNDLPENYAGFEELLVPLNKDLSYVNERGLAIANHQNEVLELDNFNLLYVALTRAVEQLHIITEKKLQGKDKIENTGFYSGVFIHYLKKLACWNTDQLEYTFGTPQRSSVKKQVISTSEDQEKCISTPWQEHDIVLLASASKLWNTKQGRAIDFGNLLHEILSKIYTKQDADQVLTSFCKKSLSSNHQKEFIKKSILNIVHHPELEGYFSEKHFVYNERELVDKDGQILIPDRLVFTNHKKVSIIDYKTGKAYLEHSVQLDNYEKVLVNMNFKVEKKILIYINETIDVVAV